VTHEPSIMFESLLNLMMERNLEGMLDMIHEEAVLTDPHYPIERMAGKAAITRGLTWGLATLVKPGFKVRRFYEAENGGTVEVATHHVLKGGMEVKFDQVFVFEVRDGKFIRIQAFVPYRQPGIGGWIPRITGFFWRLRGLA
jgi:ketosteroid isomerase-like protein